MAKMSVRPRRIRVDASTVCAISCPACANTRGKVDESIGTGYLKSRDFADMLAANPWVRSVELSGWGEPFLNPELPAILECASEHSVALTMDNGATLNGVTEDALRAVVGHRLRRVTCSIDGATQAVYRRYRRGGDLDLVIESIRRINALKAESGSRYPRLTWQFIVFAHNEHEIPAARALAAELGMSFRLKQSWDRTLSPARNEAGERPGDRALEELRRAAGRLYPHHDLSVFCHQLWEEPQLNWDGRVLGCCCNIQGGFGANAFTDGLYEAINNPDIRYAREMLLGTAEPRSDLPCSACDVYASMQSSGRYLVRGLPRHAFRIASRLYNEAGLRGLRQSIS
ncbi:MAG: radical SAM protein [Candidatus Eisenbacteria bacterium]|nr:radical SAM protein [Candidatus Eisenbacteria bacterium]